MCFIKISHEGFSIESAFQPPSKEFIELEDNSLTLQEPITKSENCYNFLEVFAAMNSQFIQQINESLEKNVKKLESMSQLVDSISLNSKKQQQKNLQILTSVDPLLEKNFGQKDYKYKLTLAGKSPKTLYKERNFDLNIALKNQNGDIIRNANTISVYLGVMTDDGQWVEQNKQGQPMVKGLNQIDLIHGKATFSKIYLREISSYYPNKKLNFVVYPKESLLKYANCTNLEQKINVEDIQPLLIKNISVLSKRK